MDPGSTRGVAALPWRVPSPPRGAWTVAALTVLVAYAVVVIAPAARKPDTINFAVYYTVSRVLLDRPAELPRIYDDDWFEAQIPAVGFHHVVDMFNAQPPTLALLFVPIAWSTPAVARLVWTLASVAFWIAGVAVMLRALLGRAPPVRIVLLAVAATAAYRPLRENFDRGQAYTLLFLLLAAMLLLLADGGRRASWLAGVPLGLALVVKTAGAWFVVMFVLSRRARPVLAAAATYVAVAVLALPVIHLESWALFFQCLGKLPDSPLRCVSAYQTVSGLFGHLFVFDPTWSPSPVVNAPRVAGLATLVVSVAAAAQSVRFARRGDDSREARLLRLGLFDALLVTLSPFAEGYHYVLVLPAAIIAVWWARESQVSLRSSLALGAGLLLLTAPQAYYSHPAIQPGALALLAYPRVYGALILWVWLGVALRDRSVEPTSE